jgi:L-ascorbate metabolism protein UlaG (beta-lactamase superfamily)
MRSLHKFHWLILIIALSSFAIQKKELKITYLANCGFLYESDNSKVLIDPFGTEFGNFFYIPSEDTKTKILEGKAPFNNIDLLLITHIHGDHFNTMLTERFLIKYRRAKLICPSQVFQQMKDSCTNFAQIESQICCPNLSINESEKLKINGVSVTALPMQHGTNRSLEGVNYSDYTDYEKTENYGYVIHFDGNNVFHQGDACLRINEKALKALDSPVDIAHLSFFDWDSVSFNILKKDLKAETVIFMHGTKPAKEFESEQFKAVVPKLVFFKQELESKIFD